MRGRRSVCENPEAAGVAGRAGQRRGGGAETGGGQVTVRAHGGRQGLLGHSATGPVASLFVDQALMETSAAGGSTPDQPRTAVAADAACPGQQRLEARLREIITYYLTAHLGRILPSPAADRPGHSLGGLVSAALGGRTCLHLTPDPDLMEHLRWVLLPALSGEPDAAVLEGVPGLRVACETPGRIDLRAWDGHGRLILHPTGAGYDRWLSYATNPVAEDYTHCYEGCPPVPCAAQEADYPDLLLHPLHRMPSLHPAERSSLLDPLDPAAMAASSRALRGALAGLPPPVNAAHDLGWPQPPGPRPGRLPREVRPEDLSFVPFTDDPRAADLGDALAVQILRLLDSGVIQPGDVLIDIKGLVTGLAGRGPAARWAQMVIHHVAHRYNLLRYRPVRPGDPVRPGQGRDHVWEVSRSALATAPGIRRDLDSRMATGR